MENLGGADSFNVKVEFNLNLLHRRMGHSGEPALQKLLRGNMVRGIEKIRGGDLAVCDICKISKLTQKPHPAAIVYNKGEDMLDLVVMDLAGPNKPRTPGDKS